MKKVTLGKCQVPNTLPAVAVLSLLLMTAGWSSAVQAKIYKTVDAEGNVVFTDVPPNDQSKSVEMDRYNTYTPVVPVTTPSTPSADETNSRAADGEEPPAPTRYDKLTVVSPRNDEAVRANSGDITINATVEPAIDNSAGHKLQVLLDGSVAGTSNSSSVALQNIDRGTHQLSAQIVDANGKVLITSDTTQFHVLRASVNRPTPFNSSSN